MNIIKALLLYQHLQLQRGYMDIPPKAYVVTKRGTWTSLQKRIHCKQIYEQQSSYQVIYACIRQCNQLWNVTLCSILKITFYICKSFIIGSVKCVCAFEGGKYVRPEYLNYLSISITIQLYPMPCVPAMVTRFV